MQIKDSNPVGLIIPVNVVAFCVSTQDSMGENPPVSSFAGITSHYDDQSGTPEAFLGDNVSRPFTDSPYNPLEKGIHIHWALPDALTKAKNNQGKLEFPAVPNRWLVTRFFISDQGSLQIKSWVVESDVLLSTSFQGQTSVTLPTKDGFGYLGRRLPFNGWPSPDDPAPSIKNVTGSELTAVSNGVVSFASYYPDCRSVFGLVDPLDQSDDPQVVNNKPIQLTYVVIGWYSDPQNDPLHSTSTLADIQKDYGWTFQTDTAEETPSFTRYYGLVQGISWNPDNPDNPNYVTQESLKDIQATVTMGSSPSEVLSGYLRSQLYPESPFFEHLLHFFQKGKHRQFMQPQREQLNKLFTLLQQSSFSMREGGIIYTIKKQEQQTSSNTTEGQQELIDLPLPLADSLNELNMCQQKCDFYRTYLDAFRSQLFADWYHIFKLDPSLQNTASLVTHSRYNKCHKLESDYRNLQQDLKTKLSALQAQLEPDSSLELKQTPALRYSQPNEPVIAIASDELSIPQRYGQDGQYNENGFLVCRLTTQILTAITVNGVSILASQFSSALLPAPNQLPISEGFNALLQETCLLNLLLVSQLSQVDISNLQPALQQLLEGESQSYYQCTGQVPSPVMMTYWAGENPWLPLFVQWSADFIPLCPTATDPTATSGGQLQSYPPNFFTANYTIDPANGGNIQYIGATINVQNAQKNNYQGHALLSPSRAEGLAQQLSEWSESYPDAAFQPLLKKLQDTPIMVQPLSGFNAALLMRCQTLQIPVKVPDGSFYKEITHDVAKIVGDRNKSSIDLLGFFNPIRAGYLTLAPPSSSSSLLQPSLQIVDVFGQKRTVSFDQLICATSMTSPTQGTAYLAPRLAQPARLLFRWISSNSSDLSEMNSHPSTSPVCGWLLPSHLGTQGLFIYNQQGQSLGTLYLSGIGSDQTIAWQSAPGNDQTIDQSIDQALANENPQLRDFANALKTGPVSKFLGLLASMDSLSSAIGAQAISSKSNMATLVGAPIALTQAYLRLEIEGAPAIHQGPQCYTPDTYSPTDSGFTQVEFPVILGVPNDGLIGYFKQNNALATDYDFSTFYTEAQVSQQGIIKPPQDNLFLTPTPGFETPQLEKTAPCVRKVLMLVDPRAQVHATTGILPTSSLSIPPDQCNDALSTLEFAFLIAPILNTVSLDGEKRLALPTPKEAGFEWSWVEENKQATGSIWTTLPDIQKTSGTAISAYTPQQLTEGWLRLNPVLLEFDLINSVTQRPNVITGEANSLNLIVTNKKLREITFTQGTLIEEGTTTNQGSIFYIHFGSLVAQEDVPKIIFSASNWSFTCFNTAPYGAYWAAVWTGPQPLTIENGDNFTIAVTNLLVSSPMTQGQIYFDYYSITGLNDGIYKDMLAIQQSSTLSTKLQGVYL